MVNQSINKWRHLGCRPLCPCCGGGEYRGRHGEYSYTKAKSRRKSTSAKRSANGKITRRDRMTARPDKFFAD
jgi:hypothetical protein